MRVSADLTRENLSATTAQWLEKIGAEVRPRPHLSPVPGRCALLVVDMNGYFASPEGPCFIPAAEAITPNIQTLIQLFRASRSPVVFTRHGHNGPDDTGMLGRFFNSFIQADTRDAQIIDAVAPLPDEAVFDKKTYDAFLNTGLQSWLEDRQISQVVIAGVLTQMCVETTARSAFCRGFEVIVPADATATATAEIHFRSLAGMASSVALILSTAQIEQSWNAKK